MKFFKCRICKNPIEADETYCIDCQTERPFKKCINCRKSKRMLQQDTWCDDCKKDSHFKGPGPKDYHKEWI